MMRLLCVFLLVLLGVARASAGEPTTPAEAADAVLAALAKKDAQALASLAQADDPDPWGVAQVLLRREEREAAKRFAAETKGTATAGLAKAVDGYPAPPDAQRIHAAIDKATAALVKGRRDAAIAALEGLTPDGAQGMWVCGVHALRGKVLGGLLPRDPTLLTNAFEASARSYRAAAEEAERLGWYVRASREFYEAASALWEVGGAEATQRMVVLLRRRTAVEGRLGSSVGEARGRYGEATALSDLGLDDEALSLLAKAEPALKEAGDLEYLARSIGHRAGILMDRGDAHGAFALGCRSADLLTRATGKGLAARFRPDPTRLRYDRVMRWVTCASWATKLGKFDLATGYQEKASVAVAESPKERLKHSVGALLSVLTGVRHHLQGRPLDALDAFAKAERHYEALGGRAREMANAWRRASAAHQAIGDLQRALETAEDALRVLRVEKVQSDIGSTLVQLARLEIRIGRGEDARAKLVEAQAIAKKEPDPALAVEALMVEAAYWRARGAIGRAIGVLKGAIVKADEHDLQRLRGGTRYMLGRLRVRTGDVTEAKRMFSEARQHFEQTQAASDFLAVRLSEGFANLELGELALAQDAFEEARGRYRAVAARPGELICLKLLAKIAFDQKDYKRSAVHAKAGLDLATETRFEGEEILAQAARGRALYYAGDRAEAEVALAAAIEAAMGYPDPEVQIVLAHHVADVRYQQGRFVEAMASARKGAEEASRYGLGLAEGEDAALRSGLLNQIYSLGRRAALGAGDHGALYEFMERARASTLVAALGGAETLRDAKVDPNLRKAEEQARAITARLRAAYRRAVRRDDRLGRRRIRKEITAAQETLRDAVTAIRRSVRSQSDLAYGDVTRLDVFQARLTDGDVALLYAREKSKREGGTLYALRIDVDTVKLVDLGPAVMVEAAIKKLYVDSKARVDPAAAKMLAGLLFRGIPRKGVTRLWIAPGELLATVPFGLLDPDRDVGLMPSVTAMGMLEDLEGEGGTKVLALGDAIYGLRDGIWLKDIPNTAKEANGVGDVVLLGAEASETNFYVELAKQERWRAVHLACHGLSDMKRGMRSTLALTEDAANDGWLDAREVFNLSVPADLVVLSACETGRSQVIRGDGLTGLMRAFMQAGAPRVICSLWKVPDDATAELMREFYRRWNPKKVAPKPGAKGKQAPAKRVSAAAALRAAQKHVREFKRDGKRIWKHPKNWGAWVLWGSPK